ncbi:transmembrane protein 272-like [Hippoglossus hippoglossus]|uniref:transmembrane protein 272-like n=1 Tax=Hippoglossus hippoglossus TaxID=8267 RepID=UPI00148C42F6|nr:transmembrane protein 272-like [Hippoglossus hippoglossus]XP_034455770.1 transmembrane protein 272-like [Hippoglossus hippoglossus]
MNPSPEDEYVPENPVLISALVVVNIIWWMVMIAGIGLGATHLHRCPVQPGIPVFLIALGAATLLSLALTYIRTGRREGTLSTLNLMCMAFMYIFSFFWFIAGTTWVYSVYPPSYTPGEAQYCHKTTFQYAFAVTTLTWVFLMLILVIGTCFAALICCRTVRARRHLIPNRNTFYGTTSKTEETAAGDV